MNTGREIIRAISQDAVIGVFPEGERAWTGAMNRLKPETLNLFHKFMHVPILPVKLKGNFFAWPRWGKGVRRARVVLSFQKPVLIDPAWDLKEIEDRLAEVIEPGDLKDEKFYCRSGNRAEDFSKVIYRCPLCYTFDSLLIIEEKCSCGQCDAILEIDERYQLKIQNNQKEIRGSLDEIYNKIRVRNGDLRGLADDQFPGEFSKHCKDDEYIIAFSNDVILYRETFPRMEKFFTASMVLTNMRLLFKSYSDHLSLDLGNLNSVTTESNFKLQLYNEANDRLYQVVFERESVLKWQDLISMTIRKEFNCMPNLR